jgi:uncharacterized protein YcbK (DUF882 family)
MLAWKQVSIYEGLYGWNGGCAYNPTPMTFGHTKNHSPRSRRSFLKSAGAWGGGLALLGSTAAAALGVVPDNRAVSFIHTHTGEKLTARYFEDGEYRPDCLCEVNHLLRDFRTGDEFPIDPSLLDILFVLRVTAQSDAPYQVISGYRSPATNALLRQHSEGVAEHSLHLEGRAIDVRLEGQSTKKLAEIARALGRGGVGFYPASDFVHVDTGRVRAW